MLIKKGTLAADKIINIDGVTNINNFVQRLILNILGLNAIFKDLFTFID